MPTNHTPNYNLSQWEAEDRVLRTDFNADNAKIDAALKAEADARTAADQSINTALAKCGNCRIYVGSYTGKGTYGSSNASSFTFPGKPLVVFLSRMDGREYMSFCVNGQKETITNDANHFRLAFTWSGNTVTWSSHQSAPIQFNDANVQYQIIALISMNG